MDNCPTSSFLHSSIVFEMLSGVSMKTLDRLKLASKDWNEITYESSFMQLHQRKTNTRYGYCIQSMFNCKNLHKFISIDNKSNYPPSGLSLDYLLRDFKVLASSNQGLFCFMSTRYRKNRFYVCKPSTGQVQALPNPKLRYITEKVTLVVLKSSPLGYKIIRLSCPKNYDHRLSTNYNIYRCEIFHSKSWAWKESKDILLPYAVFLYNPTILANGAVHWLTSNNQILAFDVANETYTTFPLPEMEYTNEYNTRDKQLVKYKGQIGFIWEAPAAGHFELWVMENYKNHAWKKTEVIKSDPLREKEPYCLPSPAALYNSETALMKGHDYVMFYNFRDSSISVTKLANLMRADEVFAFRSDFEPVDLRGRDLTKFEGRFFNYFLVGLILLLCYSLIIY